MFFLLTALLFTNRTIELNPQDAIPYGYLGNIKMQQKHYKKAIEFYTKSIEMDGKLAEAYYNRASCKINLKDKKGACLDWQKAAELDLIKATEMMNKYCK